MSSKKFPYEIKIDRVLQLNFRKVYVCSRHFLIEEKATKNHCAVNLSAPANCVICLVCTKCLVRELNSIRCCDCSPSAIVLCVNLFSSSERISNILNHGIQISVATYFAPQLSALWMLFLHSLLIRCAF